ncbi:double-strand break repair protein AddB [Hyphomonas pacifica]|uniref:double-strand break repair protein AddB n=1 Tax=Hyphomonas pacifica TaxID=1280941 RepID=UPI000DC04232|nr:double-strand break repair protein AddB [Hyphomonas pacifica]RAN34412.1 hypothetical protein HY11_15340 [Hyphomonas pacifica]
MASDGKLFGTGRPRVWTVPPGEDFLKVFAKALAEDVHLSTHPDALADAIIYVPNRRSARALSAALFEAAYESPILPPEIRALGDLESDDLPPVAESSLIDLPPALSSGKRLGLLASMVQTFYRVNYETELPASSALSAAMELSRLLDQSHLSPDTDWKELPNLVKDADLARHWESSARFLEIITTAWPALLEEQGVSDPLERRLKAAKATAEAWLAYPPEAPVIIAGSTGATPAGRELMKAALQLPRGMVVLPGLDLDADEEARVSILGEVGHPQNVLFQTLGHLNVAPEAVSQWPGASLARDRQARRRMIHEALAPADATADWRDTLDKLAAAAEVSVEAFAADALQGLSIIEAADEADEAASVALILRETLEEAGRSAALITPDAGLARRVSALLRRWGVDAPPSAGMPLSRTLAGSFIGLCAQWATDPSDPTLLVSVLNHALAAPLPGLSNLELYFLRGPRRWTSLEGLRESIRTRHEIEPYPNFTVDHQAEAEALVGKLLAIFKDTGADLSQRADIFGGDGLERIALLAAAVSETPLPWAGEDGAAASRLMEFVSEVSEYLTPMPPAALADLVNAQAAQMTVSLKQDEHPHLFIWGPLEARLQSADRVILAGLNEDVWPKRPAPDAFLPRHFRKELGLSDPEDRMGLAAHDFAQLASAPDVTLVYSARRNDAPAVASRWVWRLKTLAEGALDDKAKAMLSPEGLDPLKLSEALKQMGVDALAQDFSAEPVPTARPEGWPKKLSVTRVDTLQRDPYALWAEQVLELVRIDPLGGDLGPAPRGTAVHKALEDFEEADKPKTADYLLELLHRELMRVGETEEAWAARKAVWAGTSEWYVNWRKDRDVGGGKPKFEVRGNIELELDGGPFRLSATADRIEMNSTGEIVIVDFKTGNPPREKEVGAGLSQQMPLQALIAQKGGYEKVPAARVDQLHYVAFKAKPDAFTLGGKHNLPSDPAEMAEIAEEGLRRLIVQYRNPSAAFLSAPRVKFVKYDNGFNLLARRAEWAGDTEDGEASDG